MALITKKTTRWLIGIFSAVFGLSLLTNAATKYGVLIDRSPDPFPMPTINSSPTGIPSPSATPTPTASTAVATPSPAHK